jgi:hypothetical protein
MISARMPSFESSSFSWFGSESGAFAWSWPWLLLVVGPVILIKNIYFENFDSKFKENQITIKYFWFNLIIKTFVIFKKNPLIQTKKSQNKQQRIKKFGSYLCSVGENGNLYLSDIACDKFYWYILWAEYEFSQKN